MKEIGNDDANEGGPMRKLALLSVVFWAATALPSAADHPSGATQAEAFVILAIVVALRA